MAERKKQKIFICPDEINDAITVAARQKFISDSDYIRQACLRLLEADGLCPVPMQAAQ